MKIIAISGFKGSGKDTLANILKEKERNAEIISFATNLYKVVSVVYGKELNTHTKNKDEKQTDGVFAGMTIRNAVDNTSSKLKEVFGKDVWAKALYQTIKNRIKEDVTIIIPDVRFEGEIQLLDKLKRQGVEVEHILLFRKETLPEWTQHGLNPANPVEYKIIKKDFGATIPELQWTACSKYGTFTKVITNDGSIDDLRKSL